ncbi:hypothetical protein NIES4102_18980 [Chondrocystis sp. NIES-4102]|nr:hypothetical protein NIES4102_18980 [Chondrocystis sp. NIES-4102]
MFAKTLKSTSPINPSPSTNQHLIIELHELEAVLTKLGLYLSTAELNRLCGGQFVSLENLALADVGIILILASAIASHHFQHKHLSFRDLLLLSGTTESVGIPLYCWDNNLAVKYYLRLTFVEGVPVIVIQTQN